MKEVCVSVKSLFETYGNKLAHCTISTEDDGYYDLQTEYSGTVCMDGEVCGVVEQNDRAAILINGDGEIATTFMLTLDELSVATYNNAQRTEL